MVKRSSEQERGLSVTVDTIKNIGFRAKAA